MCKVKKLKQLYGKYKTNAKWQFQICTDQLEKLIFKEELVSVSLKNQRDKTKLY